MSSPDPYRSGLLLDCKSIRHGFFGRSGGVSTGIYDSLNCGLGSDDDPAAVKENRARVSACLAGHNDGVLTAYQTHSATAITVDAPFPPGEPPKADAIVTRTPGLVIGALAADCAPVLLADPDAQVIAAAHAGWRGATGGILEATVAAMVSAGAARERIRAAVGPCISQAAYEVGPEFEADLLACDAANAAFFVTPEDSGRAHFDLPAYVIDRLRRTGVITDPAKPPCTDPADSGFFSYRRSKRCSQPDYGRQISAIVVI